VTEDFPYLSPEIYSDYKDAKKKIMRDNDVKIIGNKGKIFYIGKLKNIENTKSAINNIINP
jgi:hypothetical protein